MRDIHRSPVNDPHKNQWRGDLMFSLIYAWKNGWVNNPYAGDFRRHRANYDVAAMAINILTYNLAASRVCHNIMRRIITSCLNEAPWRDSFRPNANKEIACL